MPLVLFDVDGTLVPSPGTEPRFAWYLLCRGRLGWRQLLATGWFFLRYWPRFGRHVPLKNKAWLTGLARAEVASLARDFIAEELAKVLFTPAVARLREHVAAGDHVVLLTGTPQFLARPLADHLGAADAVGSLCEVAAGHFCSGPPVRHPYGETKVEAARTLAAEAGMDLSAAVAYADTASDAPLMRAVGRAVAVMPDRRLQAMALDAGWEILADQSGSSIPRSR
ncbi:HAD-IB family hydrolase [Spectribacter hydrogenoxidans]|uniref:HAD-IB family hydrolase n=1 Tax=Spectribacter hydrogenoxidans TaxID=3075608 RepID=A0ABU3BWW8_9GAMM|nr:HAD-IB family hydrolase [Salinisphaera sp. W335]MDT0633797.1 HAD-IB family hydrolase [Salinisphaera sp. W335]